MAAKSDLPEVHLDPAGLDREEIYTDRRAGTIRRLTPVTVSGATDPARPVSLFSGQTQRPHFCRRAAARVRDRGEPRSRKRWPQSPEGVNAALEQAIEEAREMRRESASRIVVPEVGGGGMGPGAGGWWRQDQISLMGGSVYYRGLHHHG